MRRYLAFILLSSFISFGFSAETRAQTTPPTIANISDNRDAYAGTIPRYSRLEIRFDLDTVATNLQFPYDTQPPAGIDPGIGVSAVGLFSPDGWETVYEQPAFYYQHFLSEEHENKTWDYPTDQFDWRVRFAPHQAGEWQYRLRVEDAGGVSISAETAFTVVESDSPGFIKVSETDSRYFETDDGSYYAALGYNDYYGREITTAARSAEFANMQANGIQLVRIWLPRYNIFGSTWQPLYGGRNRFGGYLPLSGLVPYDGELRYRIDYEPRGDVGAFDGCRVIGAWGERIAVKPDTTYQIDIGYTGENIVGPRVAETSEYGLVARVGNNWALDCYEPSNAVPLATDFGGNTTTDGSTVSTISGSWTSGDSRFLPYLYLGLTNVTRGQAYVQSISVRERLDDGTLGPNIVHKPTADQHLYFQQYGSYRFDRLLQLAEQHDIAFKMVVLEKGDEIFQLLGWDGAWNNALDADLFYGDLRSTSATRWLQSAWGRYVQARWGYSTSIHSWELLNEGDPGLQSHYALADEFGKLMKCRVFGVEVSANAGAACDYDHPNGHLVTTSTWHSFPDDAFWANPNFPNIDFADIHLYHREGVPEFADAARSTFTVSATYASGFSEKPLMRSENAFYGDDFSRKILQDGDGVWLHNYLWAGLNAGGLMELYWDADHILQSERDLSYHYATISSFLQDIPLSNGHYRNISPTVSNQQLRATGQADFVNGRGHLWLQNSQHTWKRVVDGELVTPINGTVRLPGWSANAIVRANWWDTSATDQSSAVQRSQLLVADPSGTLTLAVNGLLTDTAVKFDRFSIARFSQTTAFERPHPLLK